MNTQHYEPVHAVIVPHDKYTTVLGPDFSASFPLLDHTQEELRKQVLEYVYMMADSYEVLEG